jgi:hypothetical protein
VLCIDKYDIDNNHSEVMFAIFNCNHNWIILADSILLWLTIRWNCEESASKMDAQ